MYYDIMINKYVNQDGISNTIGTILLVGLVVALVALVVLFVFNFAGEQSEGPGTASVDFTATSDGVEVTVLDKGNVDEFLVEVDGQNLATLTDVGDSEVITAEGQYNIIGRLNDGSETVINSKVISGAIEGLFTVFQDQEDGTVEAQLVERYSQDDEYEIVTNTSTSDGSTASSIIEDAREEQLLSNADSKLLQSDSGNGPIFLTDIGIPGQTADQTNATVGERVKIDKMLTSWCEGDGIYLQTSDSNKTLESDEFEFDNNCGEVQGVAKYKDGELTAVKLFNTWYNDVSYSMYTYRGEVEPPKLNVIKDGNYDMDIEVYKGENADQNTKSINTSQPLENAEVTVGNVQGTTDSSGTFSFDEKVPAGEPFFVTVNADGYNGTQIPFTIDNESGNYSRISEGVSSDSSGSLSDRSPDDPRRNPAYNDYGLYAVADNSGDNPTIKIGVNDYEPDVKVQERNTIPAGGNTTVENVGDWFNNEPSRGTNIAFSSGSIGSGGGSGGGGGSYSAGSGSSGSGIYSSTSSGVKSTSTLAASTTQVTSSADTTITNPTPTRSLNLGVLNRSQIPTGESVVIDASIKSYSTEPTTDTLKIWRADLSNSSDPVNILDRDVSIPETAEGSSTTVSESIELNITNSDNPSASPPAGGEFYDGNEYVLYASLESKGNLKEAGTLNVFNGEFTDSEIEFDAQIQVADSGLIDDSSYESDGQVLDSQTTGDDLSQAVVGDQIQITINSAVDGGASGETIDLYKNGRLVKRTKDYNGNDPIIFNETLNEPKYIDYHIGIMEATETALIDTAVVNDIEAIEGSGTSFDGGVFKPKISIVNNSSQENYNCNNKTANNYNCEIEANSDAKLNISLANSTFEDKDGNDVSDQVDNFTLNIGPDKTINDNNTLNPNQGTTGDGYYVMSDPDVFNDDKAYLIEYNATIDVGGEKVSNVDTVVVNAYTSDNVVTSFLGNINTFEGSERFDLEIQTKRSSIDETIDVFFKSDVSGVSGSYKVDNFTSEGGNVNEISTSVTEIANGIGVSESDMTDNDGSVPITVIIRDGDDDITADEDTNTYTINPDGTVTKTDIDADVTITED